MKRKWWIWCGAGLAVIAAIVVAVERTDFVGGILRGEILYRGRPTSYWRDLLRVDGQTGTISNQTIDIFRGPTAISVLVECAKDSDRNVRWPAVNLLGKFVGPSLSFTDLVMPTVRTALRDEDVEVRLQAVRVLRRMGPNARAAVVDLAKLLHDPEAQVRFWAEFVLWDVDPAMARNAEGWTPFTSKQWGFSAVFPSATPQESHVPLADLNEGVAVNSFTAAHGVTQCVVAVSEYPIEFIAASSEKLRIDSSRDWSLQSSGGKLLNDADIERNDLKGREFEIEVPGKGVIRTRLFWVGQRLYQVVVTFNREFLNKIATDYFMDSFKLDSTK